MSDVVFLPCHWPAQKGLSTSNVVYQHHLYLAHIHLETIGGLQALSVAYKCWSTYLSNAIKRQPSHARISRPCPHLAYEVGQWHGPSIKDSLHKHGMCISCNQCSLITCDISQACMHIHGMCASGKQRRPMSCSII